MGTNILEMLFSTYKIQQAVLGMSTVSLVAHVLFFIFEIFYVYEDSPKNGMNKFLWVSIVIFVPNYLGFMTYLIVRTINEKNISTHRDFSFNKKLFYKVMATSIILVVLMLLPYAINTLKTHDENINETKVAKTSNTFSSKYRDFTGEERKEIRYQEDGILDIHYSSVVKEGSLRIGIYEYNGKPIEVFEPNESGDVSIPVKKHKIYRLVAIGNNTKGSYDFSWEFNKE